ncbi:hypothetical protein [Borrelia sp. RT1S]|uniref:hypothetical protein n=1 Tax=Borrelia sp. RT1S TaxID=2898580 RepID=UPI001E4C8559|nr:hypothetical protein [Borrelia sp. RT1S]UGQ17888.1 hypothetical protein LSO05_05505 [Borrelia sp. RT1S]
MLNLFSSFKTIFRKRKETEFADMPLFVNPDQFINLAAYLLESSNTKFNLIGLMMATGVPFSHIRHKVMVKQKDSKTIVYKSDLIEEEITRHTLCDAGVVVAVMRSLVYKNTDSHIIAWKLNRIIKHLFNSNITIKTLSKIYDVILIKQSGLPARTQGCGIELVDIDTINLASKIEYIDSFKPIQINKANLSHYKMSDSRFKKTIARLVEEFLTEDDGTQKTIHTLNTYLRIKTEEKGINYRSTYRQRKHLLSRLLH